MKQENIDWLRLIKEWQSSGESQTAFCKARNLPYWTFRAHLKKTGTHTPVRRRGKSKTPFVKLPKEILPENKKIEKQGKPWLAIHLGPSGFQFEVNFKWGQ